MFVKIKTVEEIKEQFNIDEEGLVRLSDDKFCYIDIEQYENDLPENRLLEVGERDSEGFHWWQATKYIGQLIPEEFIEYKLNKV